MVQNKLSMLWKSQKIMGMGYPSINLRNSAMKRYLREFVKQALDGYPEWFKLLLFLMLVVFLVMAVPYVAGLSFQLLGGWAPLVVIAVAYLLVLWVVN